MYRHILIATDGSQLAEKAVLAGLTLAKDIGAKATAVTVYEPWATARTCYGSVVVPFDAYETASAEAASAFKSLASVCDLVRRFEVECATVHVKDQPAEGILQVASSRGCDLIVMASRGRSGLSRLVLGSHASRVLAQSQVPVLICK